MVKRKKLLGDGSGMGWRTYAAYAYDILQAPQGVTMGWISE